MFTFGCSPIIELDDARLFAQQFQQEEDRPTLRCIARANALCHHDPARCLDASSFIVRSQNDPDVQYQAVSSEEGYQRTCPDPIHASISLLVDRFCTVIRELWYLS